MCYNVVCVITHRSVVGVHHLVRQTVASVHRLVRRTVLSVVYADLARRTAISVLSLVCRTVVSVRRTTVNVHCLIRSSYISSSAQKLPARIIWIISVQDTRISCCHQALAWLYISSLSSPLQLPESRAGFSMPGRHLGRHERLPISCFPACAVSSCQCVIHTGRTVSNRRGGGGRDGGSARRVGGAENLFLLPPLDILLLLLLFIITPLSQSFLLCDINTFLFPPSRTSPLHKPPVACCIVFYTYTISCESELQTSPGQLSSSRSAIETQNTITPTPYPTPPPSLARPAGWLVVYVHGKLSSAIIATKDPAHASQCLCGSTGLVTTAMARRPFPAVFLYLRVGREGEGAVFMCISC